MICWTCHEAVQGPVCVGCGAVQPLRAGRDLFDLLGLERRYHIDASEIDVAWRAVSRKIHPDRFAKRAAVERRMSLQWTAGINEARQVLREPERRALYLATGLTRRREEGGPQLDPDFLEDIFDLQSMAASAPEVVKEQVDGMKRSLDDQLGAVFTRWEAGEGELSGVEEKLARLNYLTRIEEQIGASRG